MIEQICSSFYPKKISIFFLKAILVDIRMNAGMFCDVMKYLAVFGFFFLSIVELLTAKTA